jgi:hypothetical protein
MTGLYARNILSLDLSKYEITPAYKTLIKKFRTKKPEYISDEQYDQLSI